jgi:hypothetical protein
MPEAAVASTTEQPVSAADYVDLSRLVIESSG